MTKTLEQGFEGRTDPGWPRPRFLDRLGRLLPVPWVTPMPHFAKTDAGRRTRSKHERLCQVCGEGHPDGAEVVLFIDGGLRTRSLDEELDVEEYRNVLLRAMDDAIMHERCARLAAGFCPRLREMRAKGQLWAFAGPIEAVELHEARDEPLLSDDELGKHVYPGARIPEFPTYLALAGRAARVFEF